MFFIHYLILKKKLKKEYFLKKTKLLIFQLSNYYFLLKNNINYFLIKNYKLKKLILLINFKESQPFFSFFNANLKKTESTFSLYVILKFLKINTKFLKKKTKGFFLVLNFLKKNFFSKLITNNNLYELLINIKSLNFLLNILPNIINSFKINLFIINKKNYFFLKKFKKIKSIKRRLKKKIIKNIQNQTNF